jgi:AcrR family transcriptional regulator
MCTRWYIRWVGSVPERSARDRLLEAVVEHLGERGLGDTSLRGLAAAVGTSHRMLLYHFGSRRELLVEVTRAVERRQREAFAALLADPSASPVEVMWAMYHRIADEALWPQERLFFELYARALQGGPDAAGLLPEVVEAWLAPLGALFERLGLPPDQARAEARLALAAARGLLLDLLGTGDRAAVDAAMGAFVDRYATRAPA